MDAARHTAIFASERKLLTKTACLKEIDLNLVKTMVGISLTCMQNEIRRCKMQVGNSIFAWQIC